MEKLSVEGDNNSGKHVQGRNTDNGEVKDANPENNKKNSSRSRSKSKGSKKHHHSHHHHHSHGHKSSSKYKHSSKKRSRSRSGSKSKSKSRSRSKSKSPSGPRSNAEHKSKHKFGNNRETKKPDYHAFNQSKGKYKHKDKEKDDKQKYRFDSPPKENEAILPVGGNASSLLQNIQQVAMAQAAKMDRKLYVGNLPPGITPPAFVELLNTALMKLGATIHEGGPVISAWISADGHYAFVEFRSAEEANKAYILNNISLMGQQLKVGRPKTYTGALGGVNPLASSGLNMAASMSGANPGLPTEGTLLIGPDPGLVPDRKVIVQVPTKIVVLKNMAEPSELMIEDEYYEVKEDIREECARYGMLKSMEMPRPLDDTDKRPHIGKVFLEYATVDDAKEARRQLSGRKYAGRIIEASFYPEDLFSKKDFTFSA